VACCDLDLEVELEVMYGFQIEDLMIEDVYGLSLVVVQLFAWLQRAYLEESG